jgi:hypothetical protein
MPSHQESRSTVSTCKTPEQMQRREIPAAPKKQRTKQLKLLKPIPFNLDGAE